MSTPDDIQSFFEYLGSLKFTTFGRPFDINDPAQRMDAAKWFVQQTRNWLEWEGFPTP